MSRKEKSKFDEMAKADKVRYDQEMKDYGLDLGEEFRADSGLLGALGSFFFLPPLAGP